MMPANYATRTELGEVHERVNEIDRTVAKHDVRLGTLEAGTSANADLRAKFDRLVMIEERARGAWRTIAIGAAVVWFLVQSAALLMKLRADLWGPR